MKTLLIPIDFSENSLVAAHYALGLIAPLGIQRLILYHGDMADSTMNNQVLQDLDGVRGQLNAVNQIEITCVADNERLADGVAALTSEHDVSLLVMGITGRNKVGQRLVGSNVFHVSESVDVPVLVVPAKTVFKKIELIALALPIIENLKNHVPHEQIHALIAKLNAGLMVVNFGRGEDKTPKPILYAGLMDMFDMFDELAPSYHFPTGPDTADGIARFATDNHAQLLISIAGKSGLLQRIIKSSVTEKLAYRAAIPLMIYRSLGKNRRQPH